MSEDDRADPAAMASGMAAGSRLRSAAWWAAPILFCLAVHGLALRTWFLADDFMLLGRARECLAGRDPLPSYFLTPIGQGTVRILSERVFFLVLYAVFGVHALPFRIVVFLTQFANLALLAWVARRLSGSAVAGLLAPMVWVLNMGSVTMMGWAAPYSEVQCAFFLLCAFHFLLRYADTGQERYWRWQWVSFLLGFLALELNVVYPALAATYAMLCARRLFRRTLWLFLPSLVFAVVHRLAAQPATGIYAMHVDLAILRTLRTYWEYTVGITWLPMKLSPLLGEIPIVDRVVPLAVSATTIFLGLAPLVYVAWSALRRNWVPLFMLAWFLIVFSPLLPLRDHMAEYYVFVPSLGLALLAADALSRALAGSFVWKGIALGWLGAYLVGLLPIVRSQDRWLYDLSVRAHAMVRGVARAHAEHPGKVILLKGANGDFVWTTVTNRAYALVDAEVFLTPDTVAAFAAHPEWGKAWENPDLYVLSEEATEKALRERTAVVYEIGPSDVHEITQTYGARLAGGDTSR